MSFLNTRFFLDCLRRGVIQLRSRRAFACGQANSSPLWSCSGGPASRQLFFSPEFSYKIRSFSVDRGRDKMLDSGGDSNGGGADTNGNGVHVVKLRGLPFTTTAEEVLKFLGPSVNVVGGINGVHLTETRPGRPSGECFVRLESTQDLEQALTKDKEHMGKRYIEVFSSDELELEWALSSRFNDPGGNVRMPDDAPVVKLRGLPFGATRDDIQKFFDGLAVASDGITMLSDHTGRASGEAFVRFLDANSAMLALEKDREKIGHRYIEVFASSADEVRTYAARADSRGPPGRSYARPSPYERTDRFQGGGRFGGRGGGRGGGGGGGPMYRGDAWGPRGGGWARGGDAGGPYSVHMRGLPFKASQQDIAFFFKPVRPVAINILYDNNNRPSGEADVQFECHEDAMRAMRRDRTNMEHRYIELFLNSAPGGGGGGGFRR